MAITGPIADKAAGELPEEWRTFSSPQAPAPYGESFLERKVTSVMVKLFGHALTEEEQDALSEAVTDYAGKIVALSLINPAIDYWSKQSVSVGASGRNETKAWASDRVTILKDLRSYLIEETRSMWIDIEPLLPVITRSQPSVPTVIEPTTAFTPDPNSMEPVFDVTLLPGAGT